MTAVDEVGEEVEERLLGPVDVVDDDDERLSRQPSASRSRAGAPEELGDGNEPVESPTAEATRSTIASRSAVVADQAADLRPGGIGRVVLRDLRGLAHDLGQRPERDAVAVGQASTAEDRRLGSPCAG